MPSWLNDERGEEIGMDVPQHLHGHASDILAEELRFSSRRALWAVVLGLTPSCDGDQYCLLWGENLQTGVAGFGDSPTAAIQDFELAMEKGQSPAGSR